MTDSVEKDVLKVCFYKLADFNAPPSTNSQSARSEVQKQVWRTMRLLLEEKQFRCIELTRYKAESGSLSPAITNSPLRLLMIRGMTMPELRMSELKSDSAASTNFSSNVSAGELKRSPLRAGSQDSSNAAIANENNGALHCKSLESISSEQQHMPSMMTVEYSAPFDVAQAFADRTFALMQNLAIECRVFYGKKELFLGGSADVNGRVVGSSSNGVSASIVARKNSDSQRWQQIASKNWHEECTSNPNSPRYSPRESPRTSNTQK